MNWTEKQHGNIKLSHYKKLSMVRITYNEGKYNEKYLLLTYKEFDDLRKVMKEVDGE